MFKKILIANRGEIACRIMRTADRLGIDTVAIYSEADADSMHVRMACEKVYIGESPVSKSYLNGEKVLAAAKLTGAEAIHPGYGLLSENPGFAQATVEAGLIFIGPSSGAIKSMGSKNLAKMIMEKANIPIVPGYYGKDQSLKKLKSKADQIGYPILLKAILGGGGKGMRVVFSESELANSIEAVKRESVSFFGDSHLLVEKYITEPRHVEVQIFGDSHGNVVHLFERDCSLQRRHQKIIEEAPAPNLSESLQEKIYAVAVQSAKAINYENAGTVEFLLDNDDNFYFMEMNTRLQVEHPVTEMITGQDLVEWQFLVSVGEKLPMRQEELSINGHAIEARLYAEDPSNGFKPAPGRLHYFSYPATNKNLRIDTGVDSGMTISSFYDPLLAKLIVWAEDRETACQQMSSALKALKVIGPGVNQQFLSFLINKHEFLDGNFHTQFIDNLDIEHFTDNFIPKQEDLICACILMISTQEKAIRETSSYIADPESPWALPNCWRLYRVSYQKFKFRCLDETITINVTPSVNNYDFTFLGDEPSHFRVSEIECINGVIEAVVNNKKISADAFKVENEFTVFIENRISRFVYMDFVPPDEFNNSQIPIVTAPMSGKLVSVNVEVGEIVNAGETLLILEAMKMEHTIKAPAEGIITAVYYKINDQVSEGSELLSFEVIGDGK
ncbi:MAG: 3-methylcrotonyl-CoA carboxylase [Magnetovibrio sp.]|nr:3-methylcrotonyl-CoA carboxylase [Magnetovibrio sp.]